MFITFVVIEADIDSGGAIALTFKFFGEIFGIIGGVIGIYLSRSKNDKDMKCLWKGFITLVSLKLISKHFFNTILSVQCVFTTVSSFIGFLANVIAVHTVYLDPYDWKNTYDDYDSISDELSLVQVLTIETFLFFGKISRLRVHLFLSTTNFVKYLVQFIVSIVAATSFGCVKCCRCSCCCIYCQPMPFQQVFDLKQSLTRMTINFKSY